MAIDAPPPPPPPDPPPPPEPPSEPGDAPVDSGIDGAVPVAPELALPDPIDDFSEPPHIDPEEPAEPTFDSEPADAPDERAERDDADATQRLGGPEETKADLGQHKSQDSVEAPHSGDREEGDGFPDAGQREVEEPGGAGQPDDASELKEVGNRDDPNTQIEKRSEVSSQHPELYTGTDAPLPNVEGPHESPEGWAKDINPIREVDPSKGDHNCGECARAVQETWEGHPSVAGTESDFVHSMQGESPGTMADWANGNPESTTMDGVKQRLEDLGPGSSAVVTGYWDSGGGHYFNAVNDNGSIKAVDGQIGATGSWPPNGAEFPYDASQMHNIQAIYFDPNGRVVR